MCVCVALEMVGDSGEVLIVSAGRAFHVHCVIFDLLRVREQSILTYFKYLKHKRENNTYSEYKVCKYFFLDSYLHSHDGNNSSS